MNRINRITRPKNLGQLMAGLAPVAPGNRDLTITGVTADSRQVRNGTLFVAVPGFVHDGHNFILDAIHNGAKAIVYQNPDYDAVQGTRVPTVQVTDSRQTLAVIADRFYDHPSGLLDLVAVTGTNGKTTVLSLLDAIFRAAGLKTGTIGTLGATILDSHVPGDRTTPDAVGLQSLLARMVTADVTHAAMEITSHALDLHRAYQTSFAAAIYTNLSQDHLDWHHTMESYFASKTALFSNYVEFSPDMVGVINLDDLYGPKMLELARCRTISYGLTSQADARATQVELSPTGNRFVIRLGDEQLPVKTQLVGQFNVYNCLGAAATAWALGVKLSAIRDGLEWASGADGRFQRVDAGQPFTVLVDYAHTPEALRNVLEAARGLNPRRLICVFGCGGDRDQSKRPKMGAVATELADVTIITSDNPRSEDPETIVAQIAHGAREGRYAVQVDRRTAIADAIAEATAGDLVLIAGKGHETYQEFSDHRIDFDDRLVATEALKQSGYQSV
ncbi:MAG: UDP-N-acetylmuramoyl-L-alanyl-D-glutamate--2,6-diaminopimelate ligase [candidate division WS1 bacterium]|nr:UDP-N-acetylmuramoyl-L-alanyl-D-glutamate--2,6-diaminopimelate ligase [candidate division WS1 bacterium]